MDESGAWQNKKHEKLNNALADVIENFSMVQFIPLNRTEEESIEHLLVQIDNAIQYGEDLEVKEKDTFDYEDKEFSWNKDEN